MKPCYRLTLTVEERDHLEALTKDASTNAKRFLYARVPLLCDQGPHGPHGPGWTVASLAQALAGATPTIERLKQRFVEEGLAAALPQTAPRPTVTSEMRRRLRDAPDHPRLFTSTARTMPLDRAPAGRQGGGTLPCRQAVAHDGTAPPEKKRPAPSPEEILAHGVNGKRHLRGMHGDAEALSCTVTRQFSTADGDMFAANS